VVQAELREVADPVGDEREGGPGHEGGGPVGAHPPDKQVGAEAGGHHREDLQEVDRHHQAEDPLQGGGGDGPKGHVRVEGCVRPQRVEEVVGGEGVLEVEERSGDRPQVPRVEAAVAAVGQHPGGEMTDARPEEHGGEEQVSAKGGEVFPPRRGDCR
jgi:hypothetical protein